MSPPDCTLLLDRCGAPEFSSGRGLSRARRGTDIHGEWSFITNGDRSSRSASGPLVSPPHPYAGGVWKAGVRLSGSSADPRALLAVVRGLLVDASGVRLPLRGSLWSCVALDPLLRDGECGWRLGCACPFPSGVRMRSALCKPRGAPGVFQVLPPRCPLLSLRRRFPFPGVPPVLRPAVCFVSRFTYCLRSP